MRAFDDSVADGDIIESLSPGEAAQDYEPAEWVREQVEPLLNSSCHKEDGPVRMILDWSCHTFKYRGGRRFVSYIPAARIQKRRGAPGGRRRGAPGGRTG